MESRPEWDKSGDQGRIGKRRPAYFAGVVQLQRVRDAKLEQARQLRKRMTCAESSLWQELRQRRCGNLKFRRQQVIDGFIADFYCAEKNLVIEVDGAVHDCAKQKAVDMHREEVFKVRGIRVIRFRNEEIEFALDSVLDRICKVCDPDPTPCPSPNRGGEKDECRKAGGEAWAGEKQFCNGGATDPTPCPSPNRGGEKDECRKAGGEAWAGEKD